MVKRIICILVGLIVMFNLSACFVNEHIDRGEIKEISDNFIELFIQKDTNELFNCYCSDIRENRKEETDEEMQNAFDFIDGNIVDYEFSSFGGEEEKKTSGHIYFYQCNSRYVNVLTDMGKKYTIRFAYCHIYTEHPEYEGLWRITITDDNKTMITVGQFYPPG